MTITNIETHTHTIQAQLKQQQQLCKAPSHRAKKHLNSLHIYVKLPIIIRNLPVMGDSPEKKTI